MLSDVYKHSQSSSFYDDFFKYLSTDFTLTVGTGGTIALVASATSAGVVGAAGGWLNVPTAASLHDYQSISRGAFELLPGKPVVIEARIQLIDAATNSSNWYLGLTDTLTTGFVTNSGVTPATYNGAVFYKKAGAATIGFETSNGTTKSTVANVGTFVSGAPLVLSIWFDPGNGTTGFCTPGLNGNADLGFVPLRRQSIPLAGLVPMYLSAGVNASTAAAETLQLDYWGVQAARS